MLNFKISRTLIHLSIIKKDVLFSMNVLKITRKTILFSVQLKRARSPLLLVLMEEVQISYLTTLMWIQLEEFMSYRLFFLQIKVRKYKLKVELLDKVQKVLMLWFCVLMTWLHSILTFKISIQFLLIFMMYWMASVSSAVRHSRKNKTIIEILSRINTISQIKLLSTWKTLSVVFS